MIVNSIHNEYFSAIVMYSNEALGELLIHYGLNSLVIAQGNSDRPSYVSLRAHVVPLSVVEQSSF